jgi:hypothetical protein
MHVLLLVDAQTDALGDLGLAASGELQRVKA